MLFLKSRKKDLKKENQIGCIVLIFYIRGGGIMVEDNIVKKVAVGAGELVVKALATYGIVLLIIIALLIVISVAGSGLDIIKEALNYAVSLIP